MIKGKSFLAIIPARGGSKRLLNKNILDLAGKPLILWTIDAAINSTYIDKIVVSSDSDDILSISSRSGVSTLKRPSSLANDTATTFDVIKHTLKSYKNYDYVILLQATSPLRTSHHIDEAIILLNEKNADAILSVCEVDHSPLWSNTLDHSGSMVNFIKDDIKNKRSQDLDTYYRLNGAIYICNTKKLLAKNSFFLKENIFAYKMKKEHSVDIDDKYDLMLAKGYLN